MRLPKCVCVLVLALVVALLAGSAARAQVNTANLSGVATDPKDAVVPKAKITVTSLATGATRTAETDETGRYRFVGLPPGRYEVAVEGGTGLAKLVVSEVVLTIGQEAELPLRMGLQTLAQTLTVEVTPELIETTRTSVAETVDKLRIDNLPINGRNYINFTLTNSQAARDNAPSIGAAPTSGINFGGQRARSNQVSVDGADAGDNSVNGIRSTVSQEAVQEFQIIISNYMPEFGRATGGVINIVTRGGTNELHGNVFGFLRHKSLQARNPFSVQVDPVTGVVSPVKQGYTRVQGGATLGGPIQKDKTFYFLSYETTRRQETGFTSIGSNNFGLVPATTPVVPGVTLLLTPQQAAFVNNPAVLGAAGGPQRAAQLFLLAGSGSSVALNGVDPGLAATVLFGLPTPPGARFPVPLDCAPGGCAAGNLATLPASYVNLNSLRGNYPISEGTSLWSARLDHLWNSRNSSFVRVSVSPSLVTGIQVQAQNQNQGENAGSRTSLQEVRDLSVVGQHVTSITNSVFNEARFQFARRGLHYGFSQLPGGDRVAVNMAGFAFFGREPFSTVDRIERRFQWTDNVSWLKGKHTIKFGGDVNLIQLRSKKTQIFELNFGGLFNFGSLTPRNLGLPASVGGVSTPGLSAVQAYGLGLPQTFIQGIGVSNRPFDNKAIAFFIQDSWRFHPRWTVNYGVRYDFELTPLFPAATPINAAAENALGVVEGIPRDKNNVAPRLALAWDVRGNGRTLVRAGYGIFFDHPLLAVAFNSFTAEGAKSVQLISGGGTPTRAAFPTNLTALNGASLFQGVFNDPLGLTFYLANQQRFDPKAPTSVFADQRFLTLGIPLPILPFTLAVNKNFVYAYAQQGNLTLEQQMGKDYKISVSYSYTHGLKLNRPRDINSTDPVLLTKNFRNALVSGLSASSPLTVAVPGSDRAAGPTTCGITFAAPGLVPNVLGVLNGCPGPLAALNGQFVSTAAFFNFFRPSGPNPSFAPLLAPAFPAGTPFSALYAAQVSLAQAAGYPTGFPGVPVPLGGVDNQESTGSSIYHGLTLNFSKRFSKHFEFLSSYTFSHAIDDSTDLQTLLEPQDERRPDLERGNSTFDQRHRWVLSGVMQSPYQRNDGGAWHKFLADFTVAPIFEIASGRPFTVLTGVTSLDLAANTGRPSVLPAGGVVSPFIPGVTFTPPTNCDPGVVQVVPGLGCSGNLARNRFYRPNFFQFDLRVSRKFYFTERLNLEVIADMFNLFNKNNTADVNPLCDLSGGAGSTCTAGQPTAALDPRQFQFGLKINW